MEVNTLVDEHMLCIAMLWTSMFVTFWSIFFGASWKALTLQQSNVTIEHWFCHWNLHLLGGFPSHVWWHWRVLSQDNRIEFAVQTVRTLGREQLLMSSNQRKSYVKGIFKPNIESYDCLFHIYIYNIHVYIYISLLWFGMIQYDSQLVCEWNGLWLGLPHPETNHDWRHRHIIQGFSPGMVCCCVSPHYLSWAIVVVIIYYYLSPHDLNLHLCGLFDHYLS